MQQFSSGLDFLGQGFVHFLGHSTAMNKSVNVTIRFQPLMDHKNLTGCWILILHQAGVKISNQKTTIKKASKVMQESNGADVLYW